MNHLMFNLVKDFPLHYFLFPGKTDVFEADVARIYYMFWGQVMVHPAPHSASDSAVCMRCCSEIPCEPLKDLFLLFINLVSTQTFTVAGLRVLSVKPSLAWVFKVIGVPEMLKCFLWHEDSTTRSGNSLQKGNSSSELSTTLDQNDVKTSSTMILSQPLPAMLLPSSTGADLNPKL